MSLEKAFCFPSRAEPNVFWSQDHRAVSDETPWMDQHAKKTNFGSFVMDGELARSIRDGKPQPYGWRFSLKIDIDRAKPTAWSSAPIRSARDFPLLQAIAFWLSSMGLDFVEFLFFSSRSNLVCKCLSAGQMLIVLLTHTQHSTIRYESVLFYEGWRRKECLLFLWFHFHFRLYCIAHRYRRWQWVDRLTDRAKPSNRLVEDEMLSDRCQWGNFSQLFEKDWTKCRIVQIDRFPSFLHRRAEIDGDWTNANQHNGHDDAVTHFTSRFVPFTPSFFCSFRRLRILFEKRFFPRRTAMSHDNHMFVVFDKGNRHNIALFSRWYSH